MPNIKISERDLTSGGSLNVTSNIVYVPGLATEGPDGYEFGKPRLYSTLSDFQNDFGDIVPIIKQMTAGGLPAFELGKAYDPGFIYATELLRLGMPVLFDCLNGASNNSYKIAFGDSTVTLDKIKQAIAARLSDEKLKDKGLYNIKFISNGGYVSRDINTAIELLAANRGDCCALEDIPYNCNWTKIEEAIRLNNLNAIELSANNDNGKYAAAFAPWGVYEVPCLARYFKETKDGRNYYYRNYVELPGSFAYLVAAASSFASGVNNWAAIAGAARGSVPYLISLNEEFNEHQITPEDAGTVGLQTRDKVAINPIARINPFGDIIWGNRTLFDNNINGNLTASSFLNIRNLVSDIKKTVFRAARQMTFEQNSAILWIKFKSLIEPTLAQMVSGAGLSGYELIKKITKDKAKLVATVRLFAIEAVEDFDIEIELADDTTAITE